MIEHKNTVKGGTYATTKRYAELHILPKIANTRIEKLTVVNCQRLVNQWAEHFNSAKYPRGIVIQVLDYAIKLELIQSNNMHKGKLPKAKEIKFDVNKFYTTEELKHFFACLEDYGNLKFKAFFRLLAFTGMRKGEAVALTWKDIDFTNLTVNINKGVALDENGKAYITTPKTRKSIRKISIDQETINVLKEWKKQQAVELIKCGINALSGNQLLFTFDDNSIYRPSYLNDWLNIIINKYNLKKITLHGFRHSHCSLLFEMGKPIQVVQERLGHSNIKTTMDIYTHVTDKQRDEVADNFAKYMNF
ncbi:site-specific integrase [Aerococcaceae bacterium zg-ZJ1578]|uniref:tyrosine-type recombinase/integrase n=1 Tax=Aerococcaceae bacterium zg-252 TaxID=2796928 RepID=UPI001A302BFD|nr:site-specific integrase [Aerococcaceae bacterium zg-1578]